MVQALNGAQAAEDLSHLQVAQNARYRRAKASRQHLSKGGVLTAKNAREITQKRQSDELAKAARIIENAQKREQAREARNWAYITRMIRGTRRATDEQKLQWIKDQRINLRSNP